MLPAIRITNPKPKASVTTSARSSSKRLKRGNRGEQDLDAEVIAALESEGVGEERACDEGVLAYLEPQVVGAPALWAMAS
jgi:hypothetical protein